MAVRRNSDELIQPDGPPWVWAAFALPFTVPLWFAAAGAGSALEAGAAFALAATYVVTYGWAIFRPVPVRVACCAAVTALTVVFTAGYGHDPMYFSFPLALLAIMLPWHWAAASTIGLVLAVLAADTAAHGRVQARLMLLAAVVLAGLSVGGFWRLNQRLRAANAAIALMAVRDDRERIARDLHDVLGSTLTTVAVKAGLARRLLPDPSVKDEIADIEALARRAVDDVRSAVTAGCTLDLATTLVQVRQGLKAAGITVRVTGVPGDVDPPLRETFAYVLHEAVTNVLRHSRAGRCEIGFNATAIEVRDDGSVALGSGFLKAGNGLTGIERRVGQVGGTVLFGPAAEGSGFRVLATGPRP